MNTKSLLFLCLIMFCQLIANAQTAEVLFINNNGGSGAASLDLEIRVMPDDTVYTLFSGIDYLSATTVITVPANSILQFNYLEAGSSTVYYSNNNVVYNPGEFRVLFLYGSSSKAYSSFTGYQQSSSGSVIKYDFRHSTSTLQECDLIVRETSEVLANNFVYTDMTTGFDDEISAQSYILDLTPFDDNDNGLFAYQLPGATVGGEYILLFTAGSGTATDMYMARMNGTVTQLTATSPFVGINELPSGDNTLELYPNPAKDAIFINGAEAYGDPMTVTIYNLNGQKVLTSKSNKIDVGNLENGFYSVQTEINQTSYYNKLIISK